MRISRRTLLGGACSALGAWAKPRRPAPVGLQLYSLRYKAKKDLPGTLALARKFGFKEVETSDFYGRSAAEFRRLLDDAGLKATSMMAAYERLGGEMGAVIDDAGKLGVDYVVCSTIPHKRYLTVEEAKHAADSLNPWGEKLSSAGLRLCYHTHGTEFKSSPDGTVFDTFAKLVNPKFGNFEMDIFWIVYAYQDPVKMLHKYPGRFPLMHVKDIRKGTKLGGTPADVLEEESVPLGQGLVDIPAALRTARETGTRHYYIEDEAVDADRQIPESLRYLESIRF